MSLAVALVAPDRVLLASDSRRWDPIHERPVGDTWPKIDAREGYALLCTHSPAPHDVWRRVPIVPGESSDAFARRICAAVPPEPFERESRLAVIRLGPPVDVAVLHVQFADGRFDVLQAAHVEPPRGFALGFEWPGSDTEIPARLAEARAALEAGASEAELVALAEALLQLGASRTPKIGGTSFFISMTRDGLRSWSTPAAPATALATGTGFFLDATSTPTFRVGDPSGNQLKWDGTDLTIGQGNFTVDGNGTRIATQDSGDVFDASRGYTFNVTNGHLGVGGSDGGGSGRWVFQEAVYSSGAATNATSRLLAANGATEASMGVVAPPSPTPSFCALVADELRIDGVTTSGSAGSLAGYLTVFINNTELKLALYNPT